MATKKKIPADCMPMCKTCTYAELEDGVGVCHRFPPIPILAEEPEFTFPGIVESDWCGEYIRKLQS